MPAVRSGDPVFIVGPPRCGTTLTAAMVGATAGIHIPEETQFVEDIYARRRRMGDLRNEASFRGVVERLRTIYRRYGQIRSQAEIDAHWPGEALGAALRQRRSYRDLFDGFMTMQAARAGKRRWGNQVPRDIFASDQLLTMFPAARFVVCVRDPRDFLASYRDKGRVAGASRDPQRHRALYHPVVTSLIWRLSVARGLTLRQRLGPGRVLVVRYEDTVADPVAQARRLAEFVGEAFEEGMVGIATNNSSADQAGERIFTSSVGRWRRSLPATHVALAEAICGSWMRRTGYVAETSALARARAIGPVLSVPLAIVRGLRANAHRNGPLLGYLARRLAVAGPRSTSAIGAPSAISRPAGTGPLAPDDDAATDRLAG
jgi:hypothetical protein